MTIISSVLCQDHIYGEVLIAPPTLCALLELTQGHRDCVERQRVLDTGGVFVKGRLFGCLQPMRGFGGMGIRKKMFAAILLVRDVMCRLQ